MVSLHESPPLNGIRKSSMMPSELDDSSKKRKWEEPKAAAGDNHERILEKRSKPEITRKLPVFEVDLHLEAPLPSEWQRCLDMQSGQIHFYNTRTHKRTSRDPRRIPEPPSPTTSGHMSLDLELNLPCESQRKSQVSNNNSSRMTPSAQENSPAFLGFGDLLRESSRDNKNAGGLKRCPSWLACEGDQQEMVATVCTRCNMLVMLCKSSPSCPNCKFFHPPDQSPPKLFKERLSLLC